MARVPCVSFGGRARPILRVVVALVIPTTLAAQPDIDHPGIDCIEPGKYAVILSGIDPELEINTAKVYFRSSLYPDFYYVEMTYENGRFAGILPKPSPETTQIIYYLEAIDGVFNSARSVEWDPLVEECDDDPAVAYFTGEPGIIVGATTTGSALLPPGFSAAGIIGTIAATGIASGVGGGVGAGTAVAVAAGVAGAAGAVVVTSGGGGEETTSSPTTSVAASPDPDPGPGSTTTTAPGPSSTTTAPGSSTTTAPGSSTTTVVGSPTTTIPTTTTILTTSTTSTTSTSTTTTTAPPLNADCFTLQVLGPCKVRVNASCVNAPVDQYDWVLDMDDRWERVNITNGPSSVTYDWSGECGENSRTLKFQLTVHRGGATDTAVKSINVPGEDDLRAPPNSKPQRIQLQTHLALPPANGSVRGRITLNDAFARAVDGSQPVLIEARGASGANSVVATVTRGAREPGHWTFDLGGQPNLVRGSLRVVQGSVLSVGESAIVFRLSGQAGEIVEFTFEIRP